MQAKMTKTFRTFLEREKNRVVDYSIETDGVFIYTNSQEWDDGNGSGTFRGDTATEAMQQFREIVQRNTEGRY